TIFSRDWSSDVCSSDLFAHALDLADALGPYLHRLVEFPVAEPAPDKSDRHVHNSDVPDLNSNVLHVSVEHQSAQSINHVVQPSQIGRASCRERVCILRV